VSKKNLRSVMDQLSNIYLCIGAFVIGMIAVVVMITVILRYFFSISFIWVEEFVTYAFIFSTFMGLGICIIKREHIAVNYLFDRLSGKKKLMASLINDGISMVVLGIILSKSFNWIHAVGNQISDGLRIQMKYVYIIMPISMIIALLCCAWRMYIDIKDYSDQNVLEDK
jgi:TRAP-type C4-dicarboxylate transport system permease small subunit